MHCQGDSIKNSHLKMLTYKPWPQCQNITCMVEDITERSVRLLSSSSCVSDDSNIKTVFSFIKE